MHTPLHKTVRMNIPAGGARVAIALLLSAAGRPTHKAPGIDAEWDNPTMRAAALQRGEAVYAAHCVECHGADLKGAAGKSAPDLTDAEWLFGGDDLNEFKVHPHDVMSTVQYGIRSGHKSSRLAPPMPASSDPASPTHGLTDSELADVVDYVSHLAGGEFDLAAARRGRDVFRGKGACFDCHADDGKGDASIGSTDLTAPSTWLYGHDREAIRASIMRGRGGISPAFADKLDARQIRDVSLYVYSKAAAYEF